MIDNLAVINSNFLHADRVYDNGNGLRTFRTPVIVIKVTCSYIPIRHYTLEKQPYHYYKKNEDADLWK